jgi:uncharacterized protein (DUF1697 family)
VNVGGRKVNMKRLKEVFGDLGLTDVVTYVQSGNVVFRSDGVVEAKPIEGAIEAEFGIDVTVILRTDKEMAAVVKRNPYLAGGGTADRSKLYVTFLADKPAKGALEGVELAKFAPDEFQLLGRELYLHYPNGYGRTKLSNDFFERRTKLRATTRNWNTVTKLAELSAEHPA